MYYPIQYFLYCTHTHTHKYNMLNTKGRLGFNFVKTGKRYVFVNGVCVDIT